MENNSPITISLFKLVREKFGDKLQPLCCTKATLVHLSHILEDMVLRERIPALLFTGFQESSHWREETERYRALAEVAHQVCIFAGGNLPPESSARELHVTLRGEDPLRQEWFLALLCPQFTVLLCGQDRQLPSDDEATRQFDTLWSFDPAVMDSVLDLLEGVVGSYRPERLGALQEARRNYPPVAPDPAITTMFTSEMILFEEYLHQALVVASNSLKNQLRWRDELMSTLVHDMRTPLQGLVMALDMLNMPGMNQNTTEHLLTTAKRSANNLRELVQLILDTNQLADGELQVVWQPIPPERFLQECIAMFQPLLNAGKLECEVQVDAQVSVLWGDESLLQRVLQNLVANAIKFTPKGGQVKVRLALAPDKDMLELQVHDSGRGVAPASLGHIFDRYYQTRKSDHSGSGLGLYFCRLAVEAHGGQIRAVSQVGIGTTMTLVLPTEPPM